MHFDRAALLNPLGNIPIIVANRFTTESRDGLCGNLVRHKGRRESQIAVKLTTDCARIYLCTVSIDI